MFIEFILVIIVFAALGIVTWSWFNRSKRRRYGDLAMTVAAVMLLIINLIAFNTVSAILWGIICVFDLSKTYLQYKTGELDWIKTEWKQLFK